MAVITNQGLSFTFYTIDNVDLAPTETAIHSNISCQITFDRKTAIRARGISKTEIIYMLIPDQVLSGIESVTKISDNKGNVYKMEYVEDFYTHQQIYMAKVS